MKKVPSLALLGEGALSRSGIARVPGIAEHLAYVKAGSVRVASRLVNNLKAGHAARSYEDLQHCRVFLISVPPGRMAPVLDEMAASAIDWRRKTVGLWDSAVASMEIAELTGRGAYTATLGLVHDAEPRRLYIEGHPRAVRAFRQMLEGPHTRLLEVAPEWKHLFHAGLALAGSLSLPLVHCAFEALRRSGLPPLEAGAIVDTLMRRSVRGYRKAGKKAWSGAIPDGDGAQARLEWEALERLDPAMAALYRCLTLSRAKLWGLDPERLFPGEEMRPNPPGRI